MKNVVLLRICITIRAMTTHVTRYHWMRHCGHCLTLRLIFLQMDFNERCYRLISKIPEGKISTYKRIAKALKTKAYRAVGNAMAKNPNPITVPCHRVINSDGSIGGYSLGIDKKVNLLKKEGISIKKGKIVDYKKIKHSFI